MTRHPLDYVIGLLAILAACGIIFAVTTAAGAAEDYPKSSVGRLLYSYGDAFRGGYITGFTFALFASGMQCPIAVSGDMVLAALRTEVEGGRIALTDHDDRSLIKTVAALGCSAPWGTKGMQRGNT